MGMLYSIMYSLVWSCRQLALHIQFPFILAVNHNQAGIKPSASILSKHSKLAFRSGDTTCSFLLSSLVLSINTPLKSIRQKLPQYAKDLMKERNVAAGRK